MLYNEEYIRSLISGLNSRIDTLETAVYVLAQSLAGAGGGGGGGSGITSDVTVPPPNPAVLWLGIPGDGSLWYWDVSKQKWICLIAPAP